MAVLAPATLMDGPADSPSPAPTPSLDALVTPVPTAPPAAADPPIERMEVHFYPDDATAADAFATGKIDGIAGLLPAESEKLATGAGVDRLRYPTTTLATVLLNLRPTHPELRDVRVRQALLGVIDRNALVADALGGDGVAAGALVPPSSWAYDAGVAPVPYDTKAAARALTNAGWKKKNGVWTAKGGKDPYKLELLTVPADANPGSPRSPTSSPRPGTDFGIGVDSSPLPRRTSRPSRRRLRVRRADSPPGSSRTCTRCSRRPDPRRRRRTSSAYQDPELDALLEAARTPVEPATRIAAWKARSRGLAARQPLLPLAFPRETSSSGRSTDPRRGSSTTPGTGSGTC